VVGRTAAAVCCAPLDRAALGAALDVARGELGVCVLWGPPASGALAVVRAPDAADAPATLAALVARLGAAFGGALDVVDLASRQRG
jgi:hypothetical protein